MKVILSQRVGSITVTVEHTSRDPDKLTTPGPARPRCCRHAEGACRLPRRRDRDGAGASRRLRRADLTAGRRGGVRLTPWAPRHGCARGAGQRHPQACGQRMNVIV